MEEEEREKKSKRHIYRLSPTVLSEAKLDECE
jgi:hypothetical protein